MYKYEHYLENNVSISTIIFLSRLYNPLARRAIFVAMQYEYRAIAAKRLAISGFFLNLKRGLYYI